MALMSTIGRVPPLVKHRAASPRLLPLIAESAMLVLCVVMAWFLSANFISPAWSLLAMFNSLWMMTLLFRIEPRATVLALPELVTRSSNFVAMIFIEFGNPVPELDTVGTPGPFSSALVFYMLIFFASYALAFRLLAGGPGQMSVGPLTRFFDRYANQIAAGVVAVAAFILLWLILRGLMTGFPLIAGIDRFVYRRLVGDKITVYALNLKFLILFVMGLVAFRLPAIAPLRLAAALISMALLVVFFLFGDKFFTQLVAMCGFLAPYMYVNFDKIRKYLLVYVLGAAAALGLVFSMTWYIYSDGGTRTTASTMERLGGRIVGQGELWYLQARIGAPLIRWDETFVERNLAALQVKSVDLYAVQESLGPNYFSNRYAPARIAESIHRNAGSVTFTAALEPLGLMAFGWIGLAIMMALVGFVLALTSWYLAYAIVSRSVISAAFASLISVLVRTAITQGAPWVVFGIYNMKLFAMAAVVEIGLAVIWASQKKPERVGITRGG